MTADDLYEGVAALYCWRQAGYLGGVDCALGVGHALRNRLDASGHGNWAALLRDTEGETPYAELPQRTFPQRNEEGLRQFLYEFSFVYRGESPDSVNGAFYWYDPQMQPRLEFETDILNKKELHPRVAQVGPLWFLR